MALPQMQKPGASDPKGKAPDKNAVAAGGVAALVVAILGIFWVLNLLKQIRSGSVDVNINSVHGQINMPGVESAQRDIESQFARDRLQEYQQIRESAAAQEAGTGRLEVMELDTAAPSNPFGR